MYAFIYIHYVYKYICVINQYKTIQSSKIHLPAEEDLTNRNRN